MDNIAQLHRASLDATRVTVAGVKADEWTWSTPNDGWDVRALLNHIVAGNLWAAELGAGRTIAEVGARLDGDVLGADPVGSYDASASVAAATFEAPGALEAPCAVSYGPVPGSVYAGHRFIDVLIHGWDLAVATGQDPTLAPTLVHACIKIVEPQAEQLLASGVFGHATAAPEHGDPQTRLLA